VAVVAVLNLLNAILLAFVLRAFSRYPSVAVGSELSTPCGVHGYVPKPELGNPVTLIGPPPRTELFWTTKISEPAYVAVARLVPQNWFTPM
jgi:hypothetical protein